MTARRRRGDARRPNRTETCPSNSITANRTVIPGCLWARRCAGIPSQAEVDHGGVGLSARGSQRTFRLADPPASLKRDCEIASPDPPLIPLRLVRHPLEVPQCHLASIRRGAQSAAPGPATHPERQVRSGASLTSMRRPGAGVAAPLRPCAYSAVSRPVDAAEGGPRRSAKSPSSPGSHPVRR